MAQRPDSEIIEDNPVLDDEKTLFLPQSDPEQSCSTSPAVYSVLIYCLTLTTFATIILSIALSLYISNTSHLRKTLLRLDPHGELRCHSYSRTYSSITSPASQTTLTFSPDARYTGFSEHQDAAWNNLVPRRWPYYHHHSPTDETTSRPRVFLSSQRREC